MQLLNIHNFAKAGLNTDVTPWVLSGDYLTNVMNVKISEGRLSPTGGHEVWTDLPLGFSPGHLTPVTDATSTYWIIAGNNKVLVYNGGIFSDISREPYIISDEDNWHSCNLAEVVILNNFEIFPEYWARHDVSIPLVPLPWDATKSWEQAGEKARIIRSHKQFLFAMDLSAGGVRITDGVRWSSPADIGSVPSTWDHLDTTNVAGLTNLAGDGGAIIDGLTLRDSFVVYRERGISVFDYVGGQFVWQIRHLSTTVGVLTPNCLVEIKGSHYFIGDGDIYVNDGNSIVSLLHGKIGRHFADNYDTDNYHKSFVTKNNKDSELWFCITSSGNEYPNLAYVFNWKDVSWSVREIDQLVDASWGPESSPNLTWDKMNIQWDLTTAPWNKKHRTPLSDTIVGIQKPKSPTSHGKLLLLDVIPSVNDKPYSTIIERVSFALEGLNTTTTITRIYPHLTGPGTVNIQVGSQSHPGAATLWKPSFRFHAGKSKKIDIRTTGELHCFRFFSDSTDGVWAISGMDIEYVKAGTR